MGLFGLALGSTVQRIRTALVSEQNQLQELHERLVELSRTLEAVQEREVLGIRIATVRLDPQALTSRLRQIQSSIRVEHNPATSLYIIYADNQLPEADINAVRAVLQGTLEIDRT